MNPEPTDLNGDDDALLAKFVRLWAEAEEIWDRNVAAPGFHSYVSSDYRTVYDSLRQLQGRVFTVLEWGSGLGVVTIMANLMGFESYGIEAELSLVELSERLSRAYGATTRFAHGSFIPDEFDWDPASGDEIHRTAFDISSGYPELDMELRDFDLVFAYPWPAEHTLYRSIMREYGGRHSLLLSYDAREGIALNRCGPA